MENLLEEEESQSSPVKASFLLKTQLKGHQSKDKSTTTHCYLRKIEKQYDENEADRNVLQTEREEPCKTLPDYIQDSSLVKPGGCREGNGDDCPTEGVVMSEGTGLEDRKRNVYEKGVDCIEYEIEGVQTETGSEDNKIDESETSSKKLDAGKENKSGSGNNNREEVKEITGSHSLTCDNGNVNETNKDSFSVNAVSVSNESMHACSEITGKLLRSEGLVISPSTNEENNDSECEMQNNKEMNYEMEHQEENIEVSNDMEEEQDSYTKSGNVEGESDHRYLMLEEKGDAEDSGNSNTKAKITSSDMEDSDSESGVNGQSRNIDKEECETEGKINDGVEEGKTNHYEVEEKEESTQMEENSEDNFGLEENNEETEMKKNNLEVDKKGTLEVRDKNMNNSDLEGGENEDTQDMSKPDLERVENEEDSQNISKSDLERDENEEDSQNMSKSDLERDEDEEDSQDISKSDDLERDENEEDSQNMSKSDLERDEDEEDSQDISKSDDLERDEDEEDSQDISKSDDLERDENEEDSQDISKSDDLERDEDEEDSQDISKSDDLERGENEEDSQDISKSDDLESDENEEDSQDISKSDDLERDENEEDSQDISKSDWERDENEEDSQNRSGIVMENKGNKMEVVNEDNLGMKYNMTSPSREKGVQKSNEGARTECDVETKDTNSHDIQEEHSSEKIQDQPGAEALGTKDTQEHTKRGALDEEEEAFSSDNPMHEAEESEGEGQGLRIMTDEEMELEFEVIREEQQEMEAEGPRIEEEEQRGIRGVSVQEEMKENETPPVVSEESQSKVCENDQRDKEEKIDTNVWKINAVEGDEERQKSIDQGLGESNKIGQALGERDVNGGTDQIDVEDHDELNKDAHQISKPNVLQESQILTCKDRLNPQPKEVDRNMSEVTAAEDLQNQTSEEQITKEDACQSKRLNMAEDLQNQTDEHRSSADKEVKKEANRPQKPNSGEALLNQIIQNGSETQEMEENQSSQRSKEEVEIDEEGVMQQNTTTSQAIKELNDFGESIAIPSGCSDPAQNSSSSEITVEKEESSSDTENSSKMKHKDTHSATPRCGKEKCNMYDRNTVSGGKKTPSGQKSIAKKSTSKIKPGRQQPSSPSTQPIEQDTQDSDDSDIVILSETVRSPVNHARSREMPSLVCNVCRVLWNDSVLETIFEGNKCVTVNSKITYGAIMCFNSYANVHYEQHKEQAVRNVLERADLEKNIGDMKITEVVEWLSYLMKSGSATCCTVFDVVYNPKNADKVLSALVTPKEKDTQDSVSKQQSVSKAGEKTHKKHSRCSSSCKAKPKATASSGATLPTTSNAKKSMQFTSSAKKSVQSPSNAKKSVQSPSNAKKSIQSPSSSKKSIQSTSSTKKSIQSKHIEANIKDTPVGKELPAFSGLFKKCKATLKKSHVPLNGTPLTSSRDDSMSMNQNVVTDKMPVLKECSVYLGKPVQVPSSQRVHSPLVSSSPALPKITKRPHNEELDKGLQPRKKSRVCKHLLSTEESTHTEGSSQLGVKDALESPVNKNSTSDMSTLSASTCSSNESDKGNIMSELDENNMDTSEAEKNSNEQSPDMVSTRVSKQLDDKESIAESKQSTAKPKEDTDEKDLVKGEGCNKDIIKAQDNSEIVPRYDNKNIEPSSRKEKTGGTNIKDAEDHTLAQKPEVSIDESAESMIKPQDHSEKVEGHDEKNIKSSNKKEKTGETNMKDAEQTLTEKQVVSTDEFVENTTEHDVSEKVERHDKKNTKPPHRSEKTEATNMKDVEQTVTEKLVVSTDESAENTTELEDVSERHDKKNIKSSSRNIKNGDTNTKDEEDQTLREKQEMSMDALAKNRFSNQAKRSAVDSTTQSTKKQKVSDEVRGDSPEYQETQGTSEDLTEGMGGESLKIHRKTRSETKRLCSTDSEDSESSIPPSFEDVEGTLSDELAPSLESSDESDENTKEERPVSPLEKTEEKVLKMPKALRTRPQRSVASKKITSSSETSSDSNDQLVMDTGDSVSQSRTCMDYQLTENNEESENILIQKLGLNINAIELYCNATDSKMPTNKSMVNNRERGRPSLALQAMLKERSDLDGVAREAFDLLPFESNNVTGSGSSRERYLTNQELLVLQNICVLNPEAPDVDMFFQILIQLLLARRRVLLVPNSLALLVVAERVRREFNRAKRKGKHSEYLSQDWDARKIYTTEDFWLADKNPPNVPTVRTVLSMFCLWKNLEKRVPISLPIALEELCRNLVLWDVDKIGICVKLYSKYCTFLYEEKNLDLAEFFLNQPFIGSKTQLQKKKLLHCMAENSRSTSGNFSSRDNLNVTENDVQLLLKQCLEAEQAVLISPGPKEEENFRKYVQALKYKVDAYKKEIHLIQKVTKETEKKKFQLLSEFSNPRFEDLTQDLSKTTETLYRLLSKRTTKFEMMKEAECMAARESNKVPRLSPSVLKAIDLGEDVSDSMKELVYELLLNEVKVEEVRPALCTVVENLAKKDPSIVPSDSWIRNFARITGLKTKTHSSYVRW